MKWLMRRCQNCSRYTMKTVCPNCGSSTVIPHPAKFSPGDKYARLRMKGSENVEPADA